MTRKDDPHKPTGGATPRRLAVEAQNAGKRLDKWLSESLPELTRTRLKALIEAGAVTAGGFALKEPSFRLKGGEVFELVLPPAEPAELKGEWIALDIVFEDDDLIVVNKPAGMVVHPAAGNREGTLVNVLIAHCGASLSGIGGVARPGIVHRLDKETSGLLVAAKNDQAHQHLAALFAAHDIERVYHALVSGAPRPYSGTIDAPIARAGDRRKMAVLDNDSEREDARHAITHYKVVEAFGRKRARLAGDAVASLVECRLETGRTHQIRAHLSHIGHPVIGDPVYGRGPGLAGLKSDDEAGATAKTAVSGFKRQALHAAVLGFEHPTSGETLRFEAPPPEDFAHLLSALRAL
jgi:23S rRNA pseudouridine1911/1915/1917 synthase